MLNRNSQCYLPFGSCLRYRNCFFLVFCPSAEEHGDMSMSVGLLIQKLLGACFGCWGAGVCGTSMVVVSVQRTRNSFQEQSFFGTCVLQGIEGALAS